MKGDKRTAGQPSSDASIPGRILGSLRDALVAASRDTTQEPAADEGTELLPRDGRAGGGEAAPKPASVEAPTRTEVPSPATQGKSAAEALRDAKAPPRHPAEAADPTTRAVRGSRGEPAARAVDPKRTQLVRGKPKVAHGDFHQDPVVGWLVVVGGPGLGAYRPIYEGNNAIGRGSAQRIPIDFGDNTISSEEQAYIRYDSADRSFLFVPNLAKTNIVAVNNKRPTGAVKLEPMDMITMGRTQLAFVPFCGEDFDWSELDEIEG